MVSALGDTVFSYTKRKFHHVRVAFTVFKLIYIVLFLPLQLIFTS